MSAPSGVRTGGLKWRRHLTSIVFIAAALLVSIYAFVVDRGKVTDSERGARGAALFPAFRRNEISRIELSRGDEKLVLEREKGDGGDDEGDFRLREPVQATADPAAVETLMGALDYGNVIRRAEGQSFDAPRLRGTITMGKVVYKFALGGEAPVPEGAAYLQLDGEGTFVVGRDLVTQLLKPADTYRERTIVPYLSTALRRLEVRGPTESWAMERLDEVSFRFAEEPARRISRDAIDRVWSALAETRAESFLSDAEADRGLESPAFVVVMVPKDPEAPAGELAVGGACPGRPESVVVVRKSPSRLSACAPKVILEGLGTPKSALYDKRLFVARFDEVEELVLQALQPADGGTKLEMARKGSGWHVRSPDDRELAKDEIDMANGLVTQLVRGEGRLLEPSAKEAATFNPAVRIVVGRAESEVREEVALDRTARSNEYLVRRSADGAFIAIDRELERKLEPRATSLRGRELWSPPLEGREVASVASRCRGVDQELTRDERTFVMRKPAGYPADQGGAIDLFEGVARAKAESWVADADDGSFGLSDGCRVSVGVRDDGGTRIETLLLGREGDDGVFAQIQGRTPVFVVSKALKELLARPLVDRNVFFIDPQTLGTVVVKRGAQSATFTRREDPVFPVFARLRAEEVVHLGPAKPDEGFQSPSLEVRASTGGDAGSRTVRFTFGRATLLRDQKVYFARVDGIDATFTVAKERIDPLLGAL